MDQGMLQRFTLADIEAAMFEDGGFCILCGEPSDDAVEPDARGYRCSVCRKPFASNAGCQKRGTLRCLSSFTKNAMPVI